MFFYYEYFEVNTAIKLYQKTAVPPDIQYEELKELFLEEYQYTFTKEDFEDYKEIVHDTDGPDKVQQFVVYNYNHKQNIIIEVTPGLKNMKILNIEINQ